MRHIHPVFPMPSALLTKSSGSPFGCSCRCLFPKFHCLHITPKQTCITCPSPLHLSRTHAGTCLPSDRADAGDFLASPTPLSNADREQNEQYLADKFTGLFLVFCTSINNMRSCFFSNALFSRQVHKHNSAPHLDWTLNLQQNGHCFDIVRLAS